MRKILLILLLIIPAMVLSDITEWDEVSLVNNTLGTDIDQNGNVSLVAHSIWSNCVLYLPISQSTSNYGVAYCPDFSGNTNNGTVSGATWTNTVGGAYDFDGNDFINCGNSVELNVDQNFTVSAWMRTTNTGIGTIVSKDPDNVKYWFIAENTVGKATFVCDDNVAKSTASSSIDIDDGKWHHVVGVRDISYKIYVDGIFQNSAATNGVITNSAAINIGRREWGGAPQYLTGEIDEVMVFNRTFVSNEIYNLYMAGSTNGTGVH